jgi:hypothetical protein
MEECGPCPVFASYTLAFALQVRKKHGKTSVRVENNKNTPMSNFISSGSRVFSWGRTDRHNEADGCLSQFYERVYTTNFTLYSTMWTELY